MKEKLTLKISLSKDGLVTDWSEYKLGKKPDKIDIIKSLIEFIEETIEE